MKWIQTKDKNPITYKSGHWDGLMSDEVIAEDKDGKKWIAVLYSGFLDGTEFNDWYNNNDYSIRNIVRWAEITD